MRRTAIALLAASLLIGGCSSEGSNDKPESKPATDTPSAAVTETPVKLSTEWVPKLDAAGDGAPSGVCTEVGTEDCVKHVTALTEVVYDVESAILGADATLVYPRSMKTIERVTQASEAYVAAECKGSTDNALGDSVCARYAAQLLIGPATLSMNLETDEYSAA